MRKISLYIRGVKTADLKAVDTYVRRLVFALPKPGHKPGKLWKALFFIIFIFVFIPNVLAEDIALTLDEAVFLALRDNRNIQIGASDIEKAKSKIKEAWSVVYPSLAVNIDKDRTSHLMDKPYSTTEIHAGLKQNIFQSGRIYNSIKQSEYSKQVQEALYDKEKIEVILNVKKAFCTIMLSEYFLDLNSKVLKNSEMHLDFTKARYKKGEASQLDIENATASLDDARKVYEVSLNQVEASKELLRNLLYLQESVNVNVVGTFTYTPKEVMFDKALLKAMSDRPEIKQYEAKLRADEHALGMAKAGNLPEVYLTLDSYSGDRFITTTGITTSKWKNYNVLGLNFSWPIFDGFATKAKIEQAIVDLKQTKMLKEKTIQDIVLELKNAYLGLKNSISSLDSAESDIKFYKNNLISIKKKYKEGIASSLDFDDADLKYKLSIFNKQQALYDYIIAKSSLDKAEGGM